MPLVSTCLLAAGAALALAPGPAIGTISERAYLSVGDMFAVADRALASGNGRLGEKALRALAANPDVEVRSEARFRLAMLALAEGRLPQAATLLRQVVDEQPNAARARLELAALHQKMGNSDSALRELRSLQTIDLPPNVARFVDRLSASLQAARPLGFQLELALAPDSNVNRATRSDTLGTVFGDFTIDQKKKSGVGAAVRAMGQARLDVAEGLQLVGRGGGEANLYRDSDFNDIVLDLAAGPELRTGRMRLAAEAGVTMHWFGMKPYQRTLRLGGSLIRPVDAVSQLRLDAGVRWSNNRFNDLQDGRGRSVRIRYERALSPQLTVSASAAIDRFKARDDAYSTRAWSAGVGAQRDVGRMTVSVGADIGRLKADERLALLPEAREDRLSRFQLGLVNRGLTVAGFAPVTRLVVERNRSTVEFYDYRRTRLEFGVARAF